MNIIKRVIAAAVFAATCAVASAEHEKPDLLHTRGQMTAGARFGIGTKDKYDFGVDYTVCFNQRVGLVCQADYERATFGWSEYYGNFLIGVGPQIMCFHPATFLFINVDITGNVGYDKWYCEVLDASVAGIVGGLGASCEFEFYPTRWLDIVVGAQQYMMFGENGSYLKPIFSLGLRYVWNK